MDDNASTQLFWYIQAANSGTWFITQPSTMIADILVPEMELCQSKTDNNI